MLFVCCLVNVVILFVFGFGLILFYDLCYFGVVRFFICGWLFSCCLWLDLMLCLGNSLFWLGSV